MYCNDSNKPWGRNGEGALIQNLIFLEGGLFIMHNMFSKKQDFLPKIF